MKHNSVQLCHLLLCMSHDYVHTPPPSLSHTHTHTMHSTGRMITLPPVSTTAALGANATFSCNGTGRVLWQINGSQVRDAGQLPTFERVQVYVPLPRDDSSEVIVTATRETNATLRIMCVVDPGIGMGDLDTSDPVRLLVYGKYLCCINIIFNNGSFSCSH